MQWGSVIYRSVHPAHPDEALGAEFAIALVPTRASQASGIETRHLIPEDLRASVTGARGLQLFRRMSAKRYA